MAKRLDICIPSGMTWHAETALCVSLMFAHTLQNLFTHEIDGVRINNPRTSILSASREKGIEMALEMDATHLLFIDSDQSFPPDTALRLLSHKKPVVACNVATKQIPSSPTAWTKSGPIGSFGKTGLEQVWRVGTGVMLIELSALKFIKSPRFAVHWNAEKKEYDGEDWFFCSKLQRAGVPIFIDHDLSNEIGHLGEFTYHHGLVQPPEGFEFDTGAMENVA